MPMYYPYAPFTKVLTAEPGRWCHFQLDQPNFSPPYVAESSVFSKKVASTFPKSLVI